MIFSDLDFIKDILIQFATKYGWRIDDTTNPSRLLFLGKHGECIRVGICGSVISVRRMATDGFWFDEPSEIDLKHPDSLDDLDDILNECH